MELLDCLKTIIDPRRPQGRQYSLAPLLFISVLAVLAGADSYCKIARFIFARLRSFALNLLHSSGVTNIAEALYDNALSFDRILRYVGAVQHD